MKTRKNGRYLVYVFFVAVIYGSLAIVMATSGSSSETQGYSNSGNAAHYESWEKRNTDFEVVEMYIGDITNTGYLALVNREHAAAEVCFSVLESAWPTVPVSTVYGMYLHPSALRAVGEMFNSARAVEVGSFFVSSGFRGFELQAELYDGGANSAFALPPKHSEHHTGLAADILAVGIPMGEMGSSAQGRWLAENSYRYGLILRYPRGAEGITGIQFEPWHFRYVGREHAYFMRKHGLVLEEYIALLHERGEISFEMNGVSVNVLRQFPQNGMLRLPAEMNFSISSDNTGGYIITAWR
jgi:D-alanyl-D-alanine carboxypeptidase